MNPHLIPHLESRLLLLKGWKKARLCALSKSVFLPLSCACFCFLKKIKIKTLCTCVYACMPAFWQNCTQKNVWKLKSNMLSVSQQQKFPTVLSDPKKRT